MKIQFISGLTAFLMFLFSCSVQAQDSMLESVGSLSAVALYNSFLVIGGVGDGYADAYFSEEYVTESMAEQISFMSSLSEQMQKLVDSGELVDPSDIAFISEEISVFAGLQRQASYLKDYVSNGFLESDFNAYDGQRLQNWDDISRILGLDE